MADYVSVDGARLEYVWHGPPPLHAPTLVFLHEGLGSIGQWRNFPAELSSRLGCSALVYSRCGHGRSDALSAPQSIHFMHHEATEVLPRLLEVFEIHRPILVGHSDGASIAIIAAGSGLEARALILEAPHVFTEPFGLESIAKARTAYEQGDLKARLARHHAHVDAAFRGWNGAWLNPDFVRWNLEEFLPGISLPVQLIQGKDDEYGSVKQLEAIEQKVRGPVERVLLDQCGHSPHRDQPEKTLESMSDFVRRV